MSWPKIVERLNKGESVELHPTGNSMAPRITSGQRVLLAPLTDDPEVGDIVLSKVRGRYWLHGITRHPLGDDRYLIANASGHVNGWTSRDKIYGIVTEIGNGAKP